MTLRKAISVIMVICLVFTILTYPLSVYGKAGDDNHSTHLDGQNSNSGKQGNDDLGVGKHGKGAESGQHSDSPENEEGEEEWDDSHATHPDSEHSDGGKQGKGGSGAGKRGNGDRSEEHSDLPEREEDEEEGSGNNDEHKGGASQGGKGNGAKSSGSRKGSSKKDSAGGLITVNVTVTGLELGREVDVTLTREEDEATVKRTVNGEVTFISEPSGDCTIEGEEVPGYITPFMELSLTGDSKEVPVTLEYESGNFPVGGVSLNKEEMKLISGYTEQLIATIEPANANVQDIEWTSDDESVATVDQEGKVTGQSKGITTITATSVDGGFSASCEVNVVSITKLISLEAINALKKEVILLPKTVEAQLDDDSIVSLGVQWMDGEESLGYVFTVDKTPNSKYELSGVVVGTELTVTLIINVIPGEPAIPADGVRLNETESSLYVGTNLELIATVYSNQPNKEPTNKEVLWSSSNPAVASVVDGVVTAKSPGTSIITVETIDGGYKAYCIISVAPPPEISLIFATYENGKEVEEHFNSREEIFINVENLVDIKSITEETKYYVKVEQKGRDPLLGEGEISIGPNTKEFNLFEVTSFDITTNYSSMYFVYISADPNYPKNDESTPMANFNIGGATPTIPIENVVVSLEIVGGHREGNRENIIFLLCRELHEEDVILTTWDDYLNVSGDDKINYILNPYDYFKPLDKYFGLPLIDEVKMIGITDENGNVIWNEPKETLKLGGYYLLEVTPNGYTDNLNEYDPDSEDGALYKEVHLMRNGSVERRVINVYVGEDR